jgi:hypothetical protein
MTREQLIILLPDAIALGKSLLTQAISQGQFELAIELYKNVQWSEAQLRAVQEGQ